MRLATLNVLVKLTDALALIAVETVLEWQPHIVGLQEVGRSRRSALKRLGPVITFPNLRRVLRRRPPMKGWVTVYPLGGQPIVYDAARLSLVSVRRIVLALGRNGVRATYATECVFRDRVTGATVPVLNTHLVAHLHRDRNADANTAALITINEWCKAWDGYPAYVLGDFNKRQVSIRGMVESRRGRRTDLPTFKGRPIDKIFGRRRFVDARVVDTPSDHSALIADDQDVIL